MENNNARMSKTREMYFFRLSGRIVVFIVGILIYIFDKDAFDVADGWEFFCEFSPLHILWLVWVLCVIIYPERFWENSNMALRCSECTDKLCTQYCQKLRK